MILKVLLPTEVLINEPVLKIIAEAGNGSFCLEPRHVDFVAALVPGLLTFYPLNGGEVFLGVDAGTLVKCDAEVLVSVRDAVRGTELSQIRQAVENRFRQLDETERLARSAVSRLEAGIIRRFTEIREESP